MVVLCQRAPSLPRTKTSITPLAGDVAAGDEVSFPPRGAPSDCQLVQELPPFVVYFSYRWPSVPCTKRSRRLEF